MKRSTRVGLVLLAPAMMAFGCGQQPPVVRPRDANQAAVDCSAPAKPGEPAKPVKCSPSTTSHSGGRRVIHTPFFGGFSSGARSATPAPASSGSHVSRGGFGSSGAHFSGGS